MANNKKFQFNPNAVHSNVSETIEKMEAKDEFNLRNISIELIDHSEKNDYELSEVNKLAENIKLIGLQQNLVVRPKENGRFELLTGHRRLEALKMIGATKAPCKVENGLEGEENNLKAEYSLHSTNQQVRKEDDMSKARHIKRMAELLREMKAQGEPIKGRVHEIIAKDMNMSAMQVQRLEKLNKLIPELQEMVTKGEITMSKATHIAGMSEEDQRATMELLKENVNVSREELQKLKLQLKQKDEEKEKAVENISSELQNEIDTLKKENEKLNGEITSKTEKFNKLNNDIDKITERIKREAEKEATTKTKEEIGKLTADRSRLVKEKADTELELKQLKSKSETSKKAEDKKNEMIEKNIEIKFATNEFNRAITLFNTIMSKNNEVELSEENKNFIKDIKKQLEVANKYVDLK